MKVTLNLKAATYGTFQKQKRTTTNSRQYPVLQLQTSNQVDREKLTPTLASSAHNSHQSIFPIFVVHKMPKISGSILYKFKLGLSFLSLLSVRHLASLTTRNSGKHHVTSPFQGTKSIVLWEGALGVFVVLKYRNITLLRVTKCLPC